MNNPLILKIFCWIGLAYVLAGIIWIVKDYYSFQHIPVFRSILIIVIGLFSLFTLRWLKNNS